MGLSPAEKVKGALGAFKYERGLSEKNIRDALERHVASHAPSPKRSAGIRGESARPTIFFELGGEDFYVTVCSALSEVKAKTLLGELLIATQAVILADLPRRANLVTLVADTADSGGGPRRMLRDGAAWLRFLIHSTPRGAKFVEVHLGQALPDGVRMDSFD